MIPHAPGVQMARKSRAFFTVPVEWMNEWMNNVPEISANLERNANRFWIYPVSEFIGVSMFE